MNVRIDEMVPDSQGQHSRITISEGDFKVSRDNYL